MGTKQVKVGSLKKVSDECFLESVKIIYDDLVQTLRRDPTKYYQPVLDINGGVTQNYIFVQAAKDAGLEKMYVETPTTGDPDMFVPSNSRVILRNFVFFEDTIKVVPYRTFGEYGEECNSALSKHSLAGTETLTGQRYGIDQTLSYLMKYDIEGNLSDTELKMLFVEPTAKLHKSLEKEVGPIRSINGIARII
jgi:hypothetical protein